MTQGLPPSKEAVLPLKAKAVSDSPPAPPPRNYGFLSLRTISEAKKSVFTRSARFWVLYVPVLALFLSFSYFLTNRVSSWAPFSVNEADQVRKVTPDNGGPDELEEQGGVSGFSQDLEELGEPLNAASYDLAQLEGVDASWLDEEGTGAGSRSWPLQNSHKTAGPAAVGAGGSGGGDANSTDGNVASSMAGELPEPAIHNGELKTDEGTAPSLPFPFVLQSSFVIKKESPEFFECDRSGERSDVCFLRGEVLVFSRHNLVVLLTHDPAFPTRVETIRPYTKKWDLGVTASIWEFTIRTVNGSGGGEGGSLGKGVSVAADGKGRKRRLLQEVEVSRQGEAGSEQNGTNPSEGQTGDEVRAGGGGVGSGESKKHPWSGIQMVEGGGWDLVDDKDAPPLRDSEGKGVNSEARWEVVPSPTDGTARVAREEDVPRPLRCDVRHNVTGVIFSTGLVPLFITSQEYSGEVVLLIAEWHRNWIRKFGSVLRQLSNYPPVLLGVADEIHCFPQIVAGQVAHEEFMVQAEEMKNNVGIAEFQKMIGRAFHPRPPTALPLQAPPPSQPPPTDCHPLLTILVRDGSRKIANVDQVVRWAHKAGFAVRLVEPTHRMRLEELWTQLQEADVLLGMHGAALTHWIFLRPMTVFIQLVPFGMLWTAKLHYGEPSKQLPLQYIEVLAEPHESSLIKKYPANHTVFTNQQLYWDKGWNVVDDLYFQNQDVTWSKHNAMRILLQAKKKWEKVESSLDKSERSKRCEAAPKT